ncbi:MAG: CHAT domain-containing protein [Anaerolineae bacterium]|nr:CHAT domain-containing protein [Anaerolineae bacterium]
MINDIIYSNSLIPHVHLNFFIQVMSEDKLEILINGSEFYRLELDVRVGDISSLNNDLNRAAESLVKRIQSGLSREQLVEALLDIRDGLAFRGHLALNNIFGDNGINIIRKEIGIINNTPVLELVSDTFILPWEWLFEKSIDQIDSADDLLHIVSNFWALDRILARRHVPKQSVRGTTKQDIRKLKMPVVIGLIIDESLEFARRERSWFKGLDESLVELRELQIPNGVSDSEFIRIINTFLCQPDLDIIHFACHAEPNSENPLASYLRVADGREYEINFTNAPPMVNLHAPIIFFNACSTGIRNPLQTFQFVTTFQQRGAENIIAVEASISSQVAEIYAENFYQSFIFSNTNLSLGEAVRIARIQTLETGNKAADIVAIFYATYANPHIVVEKKGNKTNE